MTRTYECMMLIDNDAVRAGWRDVKTSIAALVEKHGGKVLAARRWDERRLAYSIRQRKRATYLLAYLELDSDAPVELRRELDISEAVLRYLIVSAAGVPARELELSAAEEEAGFTIPEPPPDDVQEEEEEYAPEEEGAEEIEVDEVMPAEGLERRRHTEADREAPQPVGASRSGSEREEV